MASALHDLAHIARRLARKILRRIPGADRLLRALAEMAIPMAVATSTRRETAEAKLAQAGLRDLFVGLVCGGEAARGKPHPDPYLAAAALLDLSPSACWAVEDSNTGVRSAVAAGFVVFQIPDQLPPSAEVLALGHTILDDANQLTKVLTALPR